MALFYFGSIEPKSAQSGHWFVSAILVILAGFFTLGLSFSFPNLPSEKPAKIQFSKTQPFPFKWVKPQKNQIKLVNKSKPKPQPKKEIKKIPAKKKKAVPQRRYVNHSAGLSHPSLQALYQKAGRIYGIDWRILAAIHLVESGQSVKHYRISYAGARGPMQFLPSTFYRYAVDGDGDGRVNIYDVDDAVFTAARYLAVNGGMAKIREALYRYNHSLR